MSDDVRLLRANELLAAARSVLSAGVIIPACRDDLCAQIDQHRQRELRRAREDAPMRFVVKDPDGLPIAAFRFESDARRFYAPLANHGFQTLP